MATSNKYDRQLRLWGANGQRALSTSRIVLIHASAVGTETVKNLVLPGIGSFHIIDEEDQQCCGSDASFPSNFFAVHHEQSNGNTMCRAHVVCDLLSELNDEVKGSWQTVPSLLDADYSLLLNDQQQNSTRQSLLVIAADLPLQILSKLSSLCWCRSIPLLSVKAYGFVGTVRIQAPYHSIVESKPDSSPPDLRITSVTDVEGSSASCKNFPELKSFVDSIDLSSLDDMAQQHVPYVVLLVKAMEQWRRQYSKTNLPQTMEEKDTFKAVIKSMSRDYQMQVNFQEAFRDAYLAYTDRSLPEEVEQVLKSTTIDGIRTNFDILVFSLKQFMDAHDGLVPLNGSIPDMTSSTDFYVQLQQVYKNKANEDLAEMREIVDSTIHSVSMLNQEHNQYAVSDEELAIFCKNIHNIQAIKMGRLDIEIQRCINGSEGCNLNCVLDTDYEDDVKECLLMACMDPSDPPQHTPLLWYLAVRACEMFQADHHSYPGGDSRPLPLQADIEEVWKKLGCILHFMGLNELDLIQDHLTKDHVAQAVSWHNAEIHNIASVIGGVASQEAVKLITHQYVPLNNTYVFNGMSSIAAVYKL